MGFGQVVGGLELPGVELNAPLLTITDVAADEAPRPVATTERSALSAAEPAVTVSTPDDDRLQLLVTLQVTVAPASSVQFAVAVLPPPLNVQEQPPLGQLDATSWNVDPAVKL